MARRPGDGAMRAATGVVSRTVPETSWNPARAAAAAPVTVTAVEDLAAVAARRSPEAPRDPLDRRFEGAGRAAAGRPARLDPAEVVREPAGRSVPIALRRADGGDEVDGGAVA